MLQEMPGLQLQHIKGHQDRAQEFHRLPLLAQLNVEADTLANRYQREHGESRPEVLLTRWAGAHLVLPSGTVTSHYESSLRYQASAEPLRDHLKTRNNWTTRTFNTINWKAHQQCIRHNLNRRTHVTKFVHAILPTNSRLHRDDQIRGLCPCCRNRREDWTHIIKCESPSRSAWRDAMLHAIDRKCDDLKTAPELRAILLKALKAWTHSLANNTETPFLVDPTSASTPALTRLIANQNDIGWKHVFLGRFCTDWSDVQDAHYATMLNKKKGNAAQANSGKKRSSMKFGPNGSWCGQ